MMTATTVLSGGKINFRGRVWEHSRLKRLVGKRVLVARDRSNGEADCCVFSLAYDFLCNAGNARRWAKILSEMRTYAGHFGI